MSRTPTHQVWIAERVVSPVPWRAREERSRRRGLLERAAGFLIDDTAGAVSGYVLMLTLLTGICLGAVHLMGRAFDRQYDSVTHTIRTAEHGGVQLVSRGGRG